MNELEFLLNEINRYFLIISKEAHKKASLDLIGHEYIATPISFIITALNILKENETIQNMKFIDVGSGIGNVCAVASFMGLNAEGIELNPVLYDISKQMHRNVKIHNFDIRNFNFYEMYDIIYYFLPFFNENLQNDLKLKIENNCKIGTYIIVFVPEDKDDRFVNIYKKQIWKKINN